MQHGELWAPQSLPQLGRWCTILPEEKATGLTLQHGKANFRVHAFGTTIGQEQRCPADLIELHATRLDQGALHHLIALDIVRHELATDARAIEAFIVFWSIL